MLENDLVRSLGIRITDRAYAEIKKRADAEHRSMANWVVVAIEEKIAREQVERQDRD